MAKKTTAKSSAKKALIARKMSKREQRDLDIEINFLEALVRRAPEYVEALQVLGDDYTKRGKFQDGLRVDEALARLRPDDSLVHYNLACSYALTDSLESAATALDRALSLGYRDFRWMSSDPDLENLRRHPAYRKIRDKVKSLQVSVD